ncbi:hypothetical protein GWK91_11440 [Virgibacillus sp. MSP4-1]|uniref:competence protein ComK n=1 Tax=Virgibacillus sp. MSP4-1 TaxID=2700081 RepID=UPI0003A38879|nr:competence protein ComK [Virgibacillus sp. MSP4-1]QHS23533.1 hypothetical protein GWK91_11440 [Virgibacillus sp. MSP4-1]
MDVTDTYRVNRKTMAIIPHSGPDYRSRIIETGKEIFCKKSVKQILEKACLEGGASLDGRRKSVEYILNTNIKLPIPVNPGMGAFFFPNKSPKEFNCSWFSFYHIEEYLKSNDKTTNLVFSNRTKAVIDTSFFAFRRQMYVTATVIAALSRDILWFSVQDNEEEKNRD